MIFRDRTDAGRRLAAELSEFAGRSDAIILGIPRGGIAVAHEIARTLHLPMDVFLSHKLGVPGHEELAFGAVAAGGARYLDQQIIRHAQISAETIAQVTSQVEALLDRRAALYRSNLPPLEIANRTVILVDDGIATGASAYAAIQALRRILPAAFVLAVPVAPAATCAWLRRYVDRLLCLHSPEDFYAVGEFFDDFTQLDDRTIVNLLLSP